jgi:hypothetical protein
MRFMTIAMSTRAAAALLVATTFALPTLAADPAGDAAGANVVKDVTNEDWKGDVTRVTDVEMTKGGVVAWKWNAAREPYTSARLTFAEPVDLSKADAFSFWIHSEKATGAVATIVAYTDVSTDAAMVYHMYKVTIDFEGWREFRVPLSKFYAARDAKGWNAIARIDFMGHHTTKPVPGTILTLAAMKFESGATPQPAPADKP